MKVEEVLKQAVSRAGVIRVNNAMNPTLWACLIVPIISWTAACFLKSTAAFLPLVIVGVVPIAVWVLQTAFFSLTDLGRLQSEEYQLRQHALNILEKKGEGEITDPSRLVEVTATQVALTEGKEGEDE